MDEISLTMPREQWGRVHRGIMRLVAERPPDDPDVVALLSLATRIVRQDMLGAIRALNLVDEKAVYGNVITYRSAESTVTVVTAPPQPSP